MQTDTMVLLLMAVQTAVFAGTLWVLIWQTSRLRRVSELSNYQHAIDALRELRKMRIIDPSLARVYPKEVRGLNEEEIKYHFFNLIVLSIFESLHVQYEAGYLPEGTWSFWKDAMARISSEESFKSLLKRSSYKIVNPSLYEVIRDLAKE